MSFGESRWPMTLAVLTPMAFALAESPHLSFFPGPLLALTEGLLLLAILFGDPAASIDRRRGCGGRRSPWSRFSWPARSGRRRSWCSTC
jgi:hypothetical protein